MGELERELKKEGVSRIELHPIADDISFYKKNGFKVNKLGDFPLKLETKPE